jgi:hypothetical protein
MASHISPKLNNPVEAGSTYLHRLARLTKADRYQDNEDEDQRDGDGPQPTFDLFTYSVLIAKL